MMEAEDTVISLDEFNAWSRDWHSLNGVPELYMKADFLNRWELAKLQHQAEISFKAGREEGVKFAHKQFDANLPEIMEQSQQLGIREVVEWVEEHGISTYGRAPLKIKWQSVNPIEWQAKLKEWGIK